MADELAACPFCGGEAHHSPNVDYVECVACNVLGPDAKRADSDAIGYVAAAIAAWNRRATPSRADVLRGLEMEAARLGNCMTAAWLRERAEKEERDGK